MKTVKTAGASLRVLKNEGEMRRFMERAQKAAPKVQPVQISLRGPDLSKNDRKRLEAKIQQIVTTEFNQAKHRIREQEQHRRQGKRAIAISLKGLPLPDHDIRLIESKVEQEITKILPRELRGQEIVVCGCGWPFGGCCDPPGENLDMNNASGETPWPPPWPPDGIYNIAVWFKESSDVMLWTLTDGASYNLTPDQMLVGLITHVDWAKEIAAWQTCTCEIAKVHQDGPNQSPVWMFLTRDQTDTIVFRKPQFLGVWTDMAHIEPTQFWPYFGGKIMIVHWIGD